MYLFLYRLLLLILLPIMLLLLVIRSKNHPEYRQRLGERLGLIHNKPFKKQGIIIHAASVGEVLALTPFVKKAIVSFPDHAITITTFTPTGSAQVKKQWGNTVQHCYLPLDIWPCTWLFLHILQPKALVLMETELWPNLINQSKKRACKVLLINGRLSEKSLPNYQKVSTLITPCLQQIDRILAQSHDNLIRLQALGAPSNTSSTSGNLKYDIEQNPTIDKKAQELSQWLPENRPLWLIASTHDGDETIALTAMKSVLQQHPDTLLIIVPRHPERFSLVSEQAKTSGFNTQLRSQASKILPQTQVWIIDSLGELMAAYKLVDIVTIGGSFSHIGGHNPLEPALFKKPIITGPRMDNFTEIHQQLTQANAIISLNKHDKPIDTANELAQTVNTLIDDHNTSKQQCQTLGQHAFNVVKENQGATQISIDALTTLLTK